LGRNAQYSGGHFQAVAKTTGIGRECFVAIQINCDVVLLHHFDTNRYTPVWQSNPAASNKQKISGNNRAKTRCNARWVKGMYRHFWTEPSEVKHLGTEFWWIF
jgi:hypothetical protein